MSLIGRLVLKIACPHQNKSYEGGHQSLLVHVFTPRFSAEGTFYQFNKIRDVLLDGGRLGAAHVIEINRANANKDAPKRIVIYCPGNMMFYDATTVRHVLENFALRGVDCLVWYSYPTRHLPRNSANYANSERLTSGKRLTDGAIAAYHLIKHSLRPQDVVIFYGQSLGGWPAASAAAALKNSQALTEDQRKQIKLVAERTFANTDLFLWGVLKEILQFLVLWPRRKKVASKLPSFLVPPVWLFSVLSTLLVVVVGSAIGLAKYCDQDGKLDVASAFNGVQDTDKMLIDVSPYTDKAKTILSDGGDDPIMKHTHLGDSTRAIQASLGEPSHAHPSGKYYVANPTNAHCCSLSRLIAIPGGDAVSDEGNTKTADSDLRDQFQIWAPNP